MGISDTSNITIQISAQFSWNRKKSQTLFQDFMQNILMDFETISDPKISSIKTLLPQEIFGKIRQILNSNIKQ